MFLSDLDVKGDSRTTMADTSVSDAQEVEMEEKVPVKFEEPIQETNENKPQK